MSIQEDPIMCRIIRINYELHNVEDSSESHGLEEWFHLDAVQNFGGGPEVEETQTIHRGTKATFCFYLTLNIL